jgi:glycosidase
MIIRNPGTGGSNGETPILEFADDQPEMDQFSPDKDWMPQLVLIAKNSYVWLDQLSKLYQRPIKTLDQIPDEELDKLARYGTTGLWLIGLWERSCASMRIKQKMGNPDAVASAYSLMDYQIAGSLGGWQALDNLRQRAWQRGIRLSADMVPNHMGIDSTWVMEHPDWFLSLSYSPFPNYTFNGEDLSNKDQVGIYLEDHYYNKSDAAVVFKRVDHGSGNVHYIYHGNDGTSMPWNDTAQLDYLNAEVREAVIQTILHVARNFPIIRFDAAMTLASKHIQRLWFPQPGEGGAIPSRTEHGMSHAQFQAALPVEFWREVVDRVAQEVPDTLLLAEAFWLMEGYFVRTLGMHRVYNSAFMHMLRDEDNANYRTVIKNILEFDPQILKRFVNFMNNPDEKSAIEQFGGGDKYFGVCTLLASMPGLPMFGHGQIEGFHEKYGMEYQRAYWDEIPNESLVAGHEWHIYPLLKRRYLFADISKFAMYDFFTPGSDVNEDVFAISNGIGDGLANESGQRALIIYHNKFSETKGWIRTSVSFMDKNSDQLTQTTLGQALGLQAHEGNFTIFRDLENGLEYIHPSQTLAMDGLYCELKAYQHHAFIDFREIDDPEGKWHTVCNDLDGGGYWSVQARYDELHDPPVTVREEVSPKKDDQDQDPGIKMKSLDK